MSKSIDDAVRETFERMAPVAPIWPDPAQRVRTAVRQDRRTRRVRFVSATATFAAVGLTAVLVSLGSGGGVTSGDETTTSPTQTTFSARARYPLPAGKSLRKLAVVGGYTFGFAEGEGRSQAGLLRWTHVSDDSTGYPVMAGVADLEDYANLLWVLHRSDGGGRLVAFEPGVVSQDFGWDVGVVPVAVAFADGDAFVLGDGVVERVDVDGDGDGGPLDTGDGTPVALAGSGARLVVVVQRAGATDLVGIDAQVGEQEFRRRQEGAVSRVALTPAGRVVAISADGVRVGNWAGTGSTRLDAENLTEVAVDGEQVWLAGGRQLLRYDAEAPDSLVRGELDQPVVDLAAEGSSVWVGHGDSVAQFGVAGEPHPSPVSASPSASGSTEPSSSTRPTPTVTSVAEATPSPRESITPTPEPSYRPSSPLASPAGPGMEIGRDYRYDLYTHCGIEFAFFDGRRWRTEPRNDGSGNPPPGWGNPYQPGLVRLLSSVEAQFRGDNGETLLFAPTALQRPICE